MEGKALAKSKNAAIQFPNFLKRLLYMRLTVSTIKILSVNCLLFMKPRCCSAAASRTWGINEEATVVLMCLLLVFLHVRDRVSLALHATPRSNGNISFLGILHWTRVLKPCMGGQGENWLRDRIRIKQTRIYSIIQVLNLSGTVWESIVPWRAIAWISYGTSQRWNTRYAIARKLPRGVRSGSKNLFSSLRGKLDLRSIKNGLPIMN